jgi:hypothetical protein
MPHALQAVIATVQRQNAVQSAHDLREQLETATSIFETRKQELSELKAQPHEPKTARRGPPRRQRSRKKPGSRKRTGTNGLTRRAHCGHQHGVNSKKATRTRSCSRRRKAPPGALDQCLGTPRHCRRRTTHTVSPPCRCSPTLPSAKRASGTHRALGTMDTQEDWTRYHAAPMAHATISSTTSGARTDEPTHQKRDHSEE